MRYCIPYRNQRDASEPAYNEVEEVLINYDSTDTTLPLFMEQHSHQTVHIRFDGIITEEDLQRVAAFNEKYHNVKVAITVRFYDDVKNMLTDSGVPFYFWDSYASSWDVLDELLSLPVCDICVSCELAFSMTIVANRIHERGKNVQVIPNIASKNSITRSGRSMNSFFIRPEDTFLYENLVDTFMFVDSDPVISYKVYKSQKWFGKLNEIIPNLESNVDNRAIPSLFGATRIRCQKRCGAKGTCRVCNLVEQLSNNMMANGMIFRKGEDNGN